MKTIIEQVTNELLLHLIEEQIKEYAMTSKMPDEERKELLAIINAMKDVNKYVYTSDEYILAIKKYARTALRTFIILSSTKDERSNEIDNFLVSIITDETAKLFSDDESINGKGEQIIEELGG